ncbi:MAG: hypothetical protein K2J10_04535 [Muribaculaceae bacterium]|nr:hypothetical protein [Muribaculaceae bacterium]
MKTNITPLRSLTVATLLAAMLNASAKDLKTEITVDRTIVPVEREATRLGSLTPQLLSSPVTMRRLSLADYTDPAAITRSASTLNPAAYADTFALSPYRGYASLGYFPVFNLGASAGYKFIDNSRTRLGAWLQYDGYSYKPYDEKVSDGKYTNNAITVGASLAQRVGSQSSVGARIGYTYGSVGLPSNFENNSQNANIFDADLSWWSRTRLIGYRLIAGFSHFGYGKDNYFDKTIFSDIPNRALTVKAASENRFNFNGGLAFFGSSVSPRGGIDVSADFVSRKNGIELTPENYQPISDGTLGIMSLTPYFTFHNGRMHGRVGVKVDLSVGGEGKKFHVAPDVMLDWNVTNQFAIYAKISGGEHLNTLRSLYDYCPFVGGVWQYQRSNVPVTADLGFNIGPFTGFSAKIFGGYAKANNWLMPQFSLLGMTSSSTSGPIIEQTNYGAYNLEGWHAGVGLSYDWRSKVKAELTAETASNDTEKAYYLWRDRAKYVINASVEVRPISALKIGVGYELRTDRHNYMNGVTPIELKSLSNLTLGASYEISNQLTVFARGENLLNRHYNLVTDIQAQGLKGLLGLSYKF